MDQGFSREAYAVTSPGLVGVATNASWVGPWIPIRRNSSVGFQVVMTGTSAPLGAWGADVTNDDDPAHGTLGATALTLTSAMTAQNPAADSANINFLFDFNPAPTARWIRFKYTRTSGGSASRLLLVGVAGGE